MNKTTLPEEYSYNECPIFKATGRKARYPSEDCQACPFKNDCPSDRFDDTVAKILEQIGNYLNESR